MVLLVIFKVFFDDVLLRNLQIMKQRSASKVSYNDIVALDETLKDLNFMRHSVLNDGNCFYMAISHQLSLIGNPLTSEEIRKNCIDYLRNNKTIGGFSWLRALPNAETKESYLTRHSTDGVFADDIMTQAAASALGYEITIITAIENLLVEPYTKKNGEIAIARVNGNLYVSLEGEGKSFNNDVKRPFTLQAHSSSHGILKQTQENYDASNTVGRAFSPIYEQSEGESKSCFIWN